MNWEILCTSDFSAGNNSKKQITRSDSGHNPDESLAIAAMGNVDTVVSGISGPFPCFAGSKRRSQLLVGWSHLGTVLWPGSIKVCGKW